VREATRETGTHRWAAMVACMDGLRGCACDRPIILAYLSQDIGWRSLGLCVGPLNLTKGLKNPPRSALEWEPQPCVFARREYSSSPSGSKDDSVAFILDAIGWDT
jgi:hypothetical protein